MKEISCGLLAYYPYQNSVEVFLVLPGGPFYHNKEWGVWSIPKGKHEGGTHLDTAKREFAEETGIKVSLFQADPLPDATTSHGKTIKAWAFESPEKFKWRSSNSFEMEWKGRMQTFPEIKGGSWFTLEEALKRITPSQQVFIHAIEEKQKELLLIMAKKQAYADAQLKEQFIREEKKKRFMEGIGKTRFDVMIDK
jgi:predicted NUDIX family NTP pyrophosphohydrolase